MEGGEKAKISFLVCATDVDFHRCSIKFDRYVGNELDDIIIFVPVLAEWPNNKSMDVRKRSRYLNSVNLYEVTIGKLVFESVKIYCKSLRRFVGD